MPVRGTKAPPLDAARLYEHAVKALAHRPRSVAEMRRLLGKRAAHEADIDTAIERLLRQRYLDDDRLADGYALFQKDVERHGRVRVLRELRRRGIAETTAAAAVQRGYAGTREEALLAAYVQKKRQRRPQSWPEAARLFRGWLRAGFSATACRNCLRQWKLDRQWLEALDDVATEAADAETREDS